NGKEKEMVGMLVCRVGVGRRVEGGESLLELVKGGMKDVMKIVGEEKYGYKVVVNDLGGWKSWVRRLFRVAVE
ncbi:hypothetical protein, partial [Bacillus velezensis]|uniref:hypothetical protein n=1 Tax=Bacillus velezensis TaxID=492670 RepID=UPI0011A7B75F